MQSGPTADQRPQICLVQLAVAVLSLFCILKEEGRKKNFKISNIGTENAKVTGYKWK